MQILKLLIKAVNKILQNFLLYSKNNIKTFDTSTYKKVEWKNNARDKILQKLIWRERNKNVTQLVLMGYFLGGLTIAFDSFAI